ncbi:MAG: TetR/AcrR family transcriptional regulator [Desulfobacterales bacterium]|nr:TetR/AcrR family transcriptional regulator [Desulfobacterales bacterium]MCP4162550.1 TetR/AcrR family transcriptional regulator [Deltaproteobacteria bacterium]
MYKMKKDKYHQILEAAICVFARNGFFQSTISQIAKEAGVADGTIYLYFKNKDDILVQFFSYKTKKVFTSFQEEVDKVGDPKDKLKNLIRRHLKEFQHDRNMAIVFQAEIKQIHKIEALKQSVSNISKMYKNIVGEIIEKGQEEGLMRKDLYLGLVKHLILGAVAEVINTWIFSSSDYDLVSMADPMVDLLLNGIASEHAV